MGAIGTGSRAGRDGGSPARGAKFVAVCDVDCRHRDDAVAKLKKLGQDSTVDQYNDFRELLDRKDIDAVTIATPDHWHALIAIDAMKRGKDVYCEKPLTLTIDEGQALVKVAPRAEAGLPDRQPAALRRAASAWPASSSATAGSARSRRIETRIGDNPEGGPFPTAAVPDGLDWDFWLGPTPEVDYVERALPLRVPLVVRVLRRQDDRLGRPPQRHRPVGPRHGRHRPRPGRVDGDAAPAQGAELLQLPTRTSRSPTPTPATPPSTATAPG